MISPFQSVFFPRLSLVKKRLILHHRRRRIMAPHFFKPFCCWFPFFIIIAFFPGYQRIHIIKVLKKGWLLNIILKTHNRADFFFNFYNSGTWILSVFLLFTLLLLSFCVLNIFCSFHSSLLLLVCHLVNTVSLLGDSNGLVAGSIFMLVLCGLTAYFFLVRNSTLVLLCESIQLWLVYDDGR